MRAFSIPRLSQSEKEAFSIYYNERSVNLLRLSLIIVFSASLGYFYLDYLSAPIHYKTFWAIRAFVLVVMAFCFALTFKKDFIVKHFQTLANFINILYNLAILLMIYISDPSEMSYHNYFIGLIVIWVASVSMRIRLKPFVFNAFVIGILYVLLAIFKQDLISRENINIFINNMFFFLSTFIAVFIADIVLEAFLRRSFLAEQILEIQNAELEQKNAEISSQNEEIVAQKKIIEKRHKQVVESIHYAQTIQKAILPSEEAMKQILGKFFVIYSPKQYVSGDFYYVMQRNEFKIVAVGDCTGHGVPGGFLAMLSISKIDNIIFNCTRLYEPSEVLEHLREEIKRSLWATRDGLDLALCVIDTSRNKLYFSGAYNPAVIMRDDKQYVLEAVRSPIGKYPKEQKFVTHSFDLQPNDTVYLFSDGLFTQRNKDNIPYGSRRFREKIKFISLLPIEDQRKLFIDEIAVWTDGVGQLDDITIMAFEF